jgi:hypothetical protein
MSCSRWRCRNCLQSVSWYTRVVKIAFLLLAALLLGWIALRGPIAGTGPAAGPGPASASAHDPDFGSWWHDGKAELNGYRLGIARYGEARRGQAVLVYVTEPFSESKRVKVDDAERNPGDTFDALKLNFVRDFQTGIYDYNTMASLFVRSDSFEPVKETFSSAEWCGQVFHELVFHESGISGRYSSYFEDESGESRLDSKPDGVVEDNLFILLRGLRGEFLAPGETRSFDFLPSPLYSRLSHRPVAWTTAEIERRIGTEAVAVPAGGFAASVYLVRVADGREGRFDVEAAYPHRIVRWNWSPPIGGDPGRSLGGEDSGELTGSTRLEYWKLHANGEESHLEALGIEPLPTPGR